jgi:transcriptional regulator
MYAPPYHRICERDELLARLGEIGFGTIVIGAAGGPVVAHAPYVLDRSGDGPCLAFHLARPNPAVEALQETRRATVVALGPDHYISPDWYQTPGLVPTWNYLAVHAAGEVAEIPATDARAHLDALSGEFERRLAPKPEWTTAKMAPDRLAAMLQGIVAFRLRIDDLQGTAKMSQNRGAEDRSGILRHLRALGTEAAGEVADLMEGFDPKG